MTIDFRPTTIAHVLALEEIRLLVLTYSYRVDGGDGDIAELFTEDAVWDSSDNGHPKLVGRDEIARFFGDSATRKRRRQRLHHVVLSPLVTRLTDEEAHAVCTFAGQALFDGRSYVVHEAGRYHDDYVRTPEGWRIRSRVLEHVFPSRSQELTLVGSDDSLGRRWS